MNGGNLFVCADAREADRVAARHPVVVLGVGKAVAAMRLVRALETHRPARIVAFGICGAYPVRHATARPVLDVLDLCVVGASVFADEGVWLDEGFRDLAAMQLGSVGPFLADGDRSRLLAARLQIPVVRAATVSTCSGTDVLSAEFARRSEAQIETMESASIAMVAREYAIPLVELRCVSNRTGARADGSFAIAEAAQRAQDAVLELLETGELDA